MKRLLLLAIFPTMFLSCEKEGKELKDICFKGRYVSRGCTDVLQLLEPLDKRLPTSNYGATDHAFGCNDIPDMYKSGEPFYFTVRSIESKMIYLTYCTPTEYYLVIENISLTPCGDPQD